VYGGFSQMMFVTAENEASSGTVNGDICENREKGVT